MHSPLSFRQQRFVIEYLRDRDALAAAGRAGFAVSARAAAARRLMGNPAVRERLGAEMRRLAAQVESLAARENWVLLRALAGLAGDGGGGFLKWVRFCQVGVRRGRWTVRGRSGFLRKMSVVC